ncbi:MAG: hypothetical protein J6X88_00900 [Bacteroidales bacterium]|nr:hypothetical protein [Bacteroidales bacterium]
MTRILISDRTHPLLSERLRAAGFDIRVEPDHDYNSLLQAVQGCDGLVVRSKVIIDRAFIDAVCSSPCQGEGDRPEGGGGVLRCIGRVGAGMETIDVAYAEQKGIRCLNSPEGNRDAVGEHTVGLLLALLNNIARADAEVRQGLWRREANRGRELGSLTVGIIGFGNMGQAFAKRLSGFGCRIIYYDIKDLKDLKDLNVLKVSLPELQAQADVVSFHVPLTNETHHYLDTAFIDAMGRPFYLLNTSRGAVVDTEALVQGLKSGKVLGAGLDVLEDENMQSDSLLTLNSQLLTHNCVFTPHVAGWTVESKYKLAAVLADKMIETLTTNH